MSTPYEREKASRYTEEAIQLVESALNTLAPLTAPEGDWQSDPRPDLLAAAAGLTRARRALLYRVEDR